MPPICALLALVDAHKLRVEDERGVGGDDATDGAVAVGKVRLDGELALLADLHAHEALIPALDDLTLADSEAERLVAVAAGVELCTIREGAGVVNLDGVACGKRLELASSRSQNAPSAQWLCARVLVKLGEQLLTALCLRARALLEDLNLETVELGNRHLV